MQQQLVSDRLKKCIQAGNVVNLFPLLKDWPEPELVALLSDINTLDEVLEYRIEEAWKELVCKPENFFSKARGQALDMAKAKAKAEILITCAEICSVAQYYLEKEKKHERDTASRG